MNWEELDDSAKRKLLFTPVSSKDGLKNWIRVFLGLDMPDGNVDPESTSNPMELIWEIYQRALLNDDPTFSRILAYASRESMKTLAAAIIEVLCIFHLGRSVAHMAAILQQAQKAQQYVQDFLRRPILRDFVTLDNARKKEVVRYYKSDSGESITTDEFASLDTNRQLQYKEIKIYITIVVCTIQSTNSEHVPFMCVSGDTPMMVGVDSSVRKRRATTARSVFARIQGKEPSGRKSAELTDLDVPVASQDVRVLSFNMESGRVEVRRVLRGHRKMAKTILVKTEASEIRVTPDHPLFVVGKGFVEAKDLVVGDRLVQVHRAKTDELSEASAPVAPRRTNVTDGEEWEQVLLGSLLGDGSLHKRVGNNPFFYENHSLKQRDYLEWKRSILSRKLRIKDTKPTSGYTQQPLCGIASGNSPLLAQYVNVRSALEHLDRLTPLGLAVWYMDDGCATNGFRLSTEGFTEEQNWILRDFLSERFGIETEVGSYDKAGRKLFYLHGGIAAKRQLVSLCKPHIHPVLAYKFDLTANTKPCCVCGHHFWPADEGSASTVCSSRVCKAVKAGTLKQVQVRDIHRDEKLVDVYDFTVEGNHNFFAAGLLNKNCVDEIDVVKDPRAYEEAKMIPSPQGEKLPITFLTSTRKFSFGMVQDEIDKAGGSGLRVRHWNILDVTEKCPDTRHLPEKPKRKVFVNKDKLLTILPEEFDSVPDAERGQYEEDTAFDGCVTKCKMFAICRGRLATHQKPRDPNSKYPSMLKPIQHVENTLGSVSVEMAKAQYLCWKPTTTGLIYPNLDRTIHVVSPAKIAEMITGEKISPTLTKAQLVQMLKERKVKFVAGMDFGYTHNFAVVLAALDGGRAFIIDVISQAELELEQQIDVCNAKIKHYNPKIYADPENPQNIKTFKRKGFRIEPVVKNHGSVLGGIEIVRGLIRSGTGKARLFFLEDPSVNILYTRMAKYRWSLDAIGEPTDVPDDKLDDECDALRYLCMSQFAGAGKVVADSATPVPDLVANSQQSTKDYQYNENNWMKNAIASATGDSSGDATPTATSVKKGGFVFSVE